MKVKVVAIRDTKNPLLKQMELRAVIERSAEANPVAFFLQGTPNVTQQNETRVAWQTVSLDFLKKFKIEVGTDLGTAINKPVSLVVKESHFPRVWINADGSKGQSNAKINPNTKAILCVDNSPIFRNTFLSLDGKTIIFDPRNTPQGITLDAKDEFIQHTTFLMPGEDVVTSVSTAVSELQLP